MCRGLSSLPNCCLERAKGIKTRLGVFLQVSKKSYSSVQAKKEKADSRPSSEEAKKWRHSLDKMLSHKYGLSAFRAFLHSEYSEENIEFWLACEDYKKTKSPAKRASKAKKIYVEFIETDAPKEVNIDYETKDSTKRNLQKPSRSSFDVAQRKIYNLMEKDSYARFLRSDVYLNLIKQTERTSNLAEVNRQSQT
ncbi:regulator of G-protein signaling 5-like [Hemiscyllium ocellatum]|uniref:regulator of G-protein signaling 5-like n=1 Tax=Hemiscyllium ocellatum TaxID=170820 RepID=UPI0029660139|nr:regulator of G-protein signaling 5-like [Hemiscyllium ocellatum]